MGNSQASRAHIYNKTDEKLVVVVTDVKNQSPKTIRLQPEELQCVETRKKGKITLAAFKGRDAWNKGKNCDKSYFTDDSKRMFVVRKDRDGDLVIVTAKCFCNCDLVIV